MGEDDAAIARGALDNADPDPSGPPRLLAWALATFHAALLVALVVAAFFLAGVAGNQLAALDTSVGVVAYLYLWGVTGWTNRRMLDVIEPGLVTGSASPSRVFAVATKWGGATGLLVFLPALAVGTVFFVAGGGLEAVPFLALVAAIGTVVSVGVGGIVGGGFALLDLLLLRLAGTWLPGGGSRPVRSES